jgi:acyl-coenzyme A thioesterase PaaI-like protein
MPISLAHMSDDLAAPAEFETPEGYTLLDWRRGFGRQIGPLYRRATNGAFTMGFRVEDHHTNGMMNAHGGMLMTFAGLGANRLCRDVVLLGDDPAHGGFSLQCAPRRLG